MAQCEFLRDVFGFVLTIGLPVQYHLCRGVVCSNSYRRIIH